jgi:manganese/zinc/iron transport system permease protein
VPCSWHQPAAARQWAHRLGIVAALAALFGALAGFLGTLLAHWLSAPGVAVPTGPTIVLTATMITLISLAIAPGRGLIWQLFRPTKLEAPPA